MKEKVLDGTALANEIINSVKNEIGENNYFPRLAAIIVGNDEGCITYQNWKEKKCEQAGILYSLYNFKKAKDSEITKLIEKLNSDEEVHGIMIQIPLPKKNDENKLLELIKPEKDVDGLNYINVAKSHYTSAFIPCAAEGIIRLLDKYEINVEGKKAVVIGRGRLLGNPIAELLEKNNAYVTKLHSGIELSNLERELESADVIVSASGRKNIVNSKILKKGVIAVDCANTEKEREFTEEIFEVAEYVSTTPGGIGPMTIAILVNNVLKAYKKLEGIA